MLNYLTKKSIGGKIGWSVPVAVGLYAIQPIKPIANPK